MFKDVKIKNSIQSINKRKSKTYLKSVIVEHAT
jgi:hypothetical protein